MNRKFREFILDRYPNASEIEAVRGARSRNAWRNGSGDDAQYIITSDVRTKQTVISQKVLRALKPGDCYLIRWSGHGIFEVIISEEFRSWIVDQKPDYFESCDAHTIVLDTIPYGHIIIKSLHNSTSLNVVKVM